MDCVGININNNVSFQGKGTKAIKKVQQNVHMNDLPAIRKKAVINADAIMESVRLGYIDADEALSKLSKLAAKYGYKAK